MEKSLLDILKELLASPAQFWSLFVLTFSIMGLGIYIGASGRYILSTDKVLANVVTKQDLKLALSDFIEMLDGRYQSIPLCAKTHEDISKSIDRLEIRQGTRA